MNSLALQPVRKLFPTLLPIHIRQAVEVTTVYPNARPEHFFAFTSIASKQRKADRAREHAINFLLY